MSARRLLCIGECMMELVPAGGDLLKQGFAGDTFNTAWYARQLLPAGYSVDYLTAVGSDPMSEKLIGFMHGSGIGIGPVRIIRGGRLGVYMIHLDEYGERSFSYWRDTSAARKLADDPDALRSAIERSDVIHFSGITLAILPPEGRETLLSELRRARAAGSVVAFDPNIRPALWENPQVMKDTCIQAARAASIVLPGMDEEKAYFSMNSPEEVIGRYLALGVDMVMLKCGADGGVLHVEGQNVAIPPATVRDVVDTTAAGDSFAGGFLAMLMQGEGAERAARVAAGLAARVIAHPGALVRLKLSATSTG